MTMRPALWIVARVFVLLGFSVFLILPANPSNVNADLMGDVMMATFAAIIVFVTFTRMYRSGRGQWLNTYSLSAPFFPMRSYPLSFWGVLSSTLLIEGACDSLYGLVFWNERLPMAENYLAVGAAILGSMEVWKRVHRVKGF